MSLRDCLQYTIPNQDCCDNFGHCAVLHRYENPVTDCVQADRGCATTFDIKIEIQPFSGQNFSEKLEASKMGHMSKVMYKFFYKPDHPDNLAANGGSPLYLVTSESKFILDGFDAKTIVHSDVIEWLGEKFMIFSMSNWGGETCITDGCDKIDHQSGLLCFFKDNYQERNADIDVDTFALDGEIMT